MFDELKYLAYKTRKDFGVDENTRIDIFALAMEQQNLTVVLYPLGKHMSGALLKGEESSVIAINSEMSKGRERFSLAHELYHLMYDGNLKKGIVCPSIIGSKEETERKADAFAGYLLIPEHALKERLDREKKKTGGKLTVEGVLALEHFFGVSRQAMLYRLKEIKEITSREYEDYLEDVKYYARIHGYSTSLYEGQPEEMQRMTLGHYIQLAETLHTEGKISTGKYEEYLMDAFRSDIVYGVEEESSVD